ncbi:MAG: EAL domain-containing protein [Oscillospiraceae bacterium]|nr:EAL domain-containing protein [Oscillospiraceae bacterium]
MSKLERALKYGRNYAFSMKYKAGFPVEFLGGKDCDQSMMSSIIHPDDYMPFCEEVNAVIDGRSDRINTHSRLDLTGVYRWYYISAVPERSSENSTEFLGTINDVSDYLECGAEDAVLECFKVKLNKSFEMEKEPPPLREILGEQYLELIQEPFARVKGLYSAIVSPSGSVIACAGGQSKSHNINKMSYQRKKSIRIKHKTAAEWIIAGESLEDINDNSSLLDIMVQTVSSIANSYVVIGEEVENRQNANKLLGENFEDQMLINSIYTSVLKCKTSSEAFGRIIPLVKDYFALERIIFCIDIENPPKIYHWDEKGSIIPAVGDFITNEKINEELDINPVVCVDEDEVRGTKSERNRSCALSRIYDNGEARGVFMFISKKSGRTWTNRERKVLRSVTQILTTLIYRSFAENKLALSQEHMQRLAFRDAATGIPNRTAFENDFEKLVQEEKSGAVITFEIANYKDMTTSYGCQYTDNIVGSIAEYLAAIPSDNPTNVYLFKSYIMFAVIENADKDAALAFAKRVLEKFSKKWYYDDTDHEIDMYARVNFFPDEVYTAEECENVVSEALRLEKNETGLEYVSVIPDIENRVDENIRIRKMLSEDAKNGFEGFYYLYSPVTDAKTGEPKSCECRLFWKRDGFIAPRDKILPIVERLGLLSELYEFEINKICAFCDSIRKMGYPEFRVGVEYPRFALDSDDFVVATKKLLEKYSLPPRAIGVAVSESSGTLTKSSVSLKRLSQLGINIISEDKGRSMLPETLFKTTYVNIAKISSKRLFGDEISSDYLKTMIEKAHQNGMLVCVSGVDSDKIRKLALKFNVDLIQGAVNGQPLHSADFTEKLKEKTG